MEERASSQGQSESPEGVHGRSPILVPDPLERLEAELGDGKSGRSGDERMYEEAQRLLEEAWSVLTECLGIRDGLLEACREVEETMGGMQHRLSALSVGIDLEESESESESESAVSLLSSSDHKHTADSDHLRDR